VLERKNDAKNRHLGTITQLCRAESPRIAIKACIDNWKRNLSNLLNSTMSSTCPYNMANFTAPAAEISWRVWGTSATFNRFHVLASFLHRRRSPEDNHTLHDVWASPGLVHYVYIFGGSCRQTEFRHMQNSLCVQVLHSPTLAVLLHGTLRSGTRNGITQLSQRAPPIFGWAAITLCIGPHSIFL